MGWGAKAELRLVADQGGGTVSITGMEDPEVYRAAQLIFRKHGLSALDQARNRRLDMLVQHDVLGDAIWGQ